MPSGGFNPGPGPAPGSGYGASIGPGLGPYGGLGGSGATELPVSGPWFSGAPASLGYGPNTSPPAPSVPSSSGGQSSPWGSGQGWGNPSGTSIGSMALNSLGSQIGGNLDPQGLDLWGLGPINQMIGRSGNLSGGGGIGTATIGSNVFDNWYNPATMGPYASLYHNLYVPGMQSWGMNFGQPQFGTNGQLGGFNQWGGTNTGWAGSFQSPLLTPTTASILSMLMGGSGGQFAPINPWFQGGVRQ